MNKWILLLLAGGQLLAEPQMNSNLVVLQGRIDFFRGCAVHSPLPEAFFQETAESSLYSMGADYAPTNGVMERDQDRVLSEREIAQTVQFFKGKDLPFIWWTASKNLEGKGFQFGGILTGISRDLSKGLPPKPAVSSGLEIRKIHSEEDLRTFAHLIAMGFGCGKAEEDYFQINRASLKEQVHFLALFDGVPVGTATLAAGPVSGGIWNLATHSGYRKKGIGSALIYAALEEAVKRGCPQAMAILMPKGLAWGVFAKMGFAEACQFPFYVYGVSAEELEK